MEDDILGISWHVNYWDYLGWKDTFATEENTERQYRYATTMHERRVYTPQAIINGRTHTLGSDETEVRNVVAAGAARQGYDCSDGRVSKR